MPAQALFSEEFDEPEIALCHFPPLPTLIVLYLKMVIKMLTNKFKSCIFVV